MGRIEHHYMGGYRVTYTHEQPKKKEQRFTVENSIGAHKYALEVGKKAYSYEYQGKRYTDTPEGIFKAAGACDSYSGIDLYNRALIVRNLARAEAIDNKIQAEKAEEERKAKAMAFNGKHEDLKGYIEDLRLLHAEVSETRHIAKEVVRKATEEYNEAMRNGNPSAQMITRGKLAEAEEKYKTTVKELEKLAEEKIRAGRKDIEDHLSGYYRADGASLDADTLALFNSGLKLKASEYEELLDRFSGSPTMQRLIVQKAEAEEIESQAVLNASRMINGQGKQELADYDALANLVMYSAGSDEGRADTWGYNSAHFDNMADTLSANYAGYAPCNKGE